MNFPSARVNSRLVISVLSVFHLQKKPPKCNKKKPSFCDAAVRPATSISHRNEAEVRRREIEAEYYSNQSQHIGFEG